MQNKKILLFDIETSPNLGAYFQLYKEGNIVWTEKNWHVMSWVAKWLGDKKTIIKALPDYPGYKKNPEDDKALCEDLWKLLDEADVVIAHNGDQFDIKKMNARFIVNGLKPPTPFVSIDTKKVAKKYFNFDSNKLNDLGVILGLGEKEDTGGIELWKQCINGDMDAWKTMKKYNKQDVLLLEKVYLHMRPWMTNHPNMNLLGDTNHSCPNCASAHMQKRGTGRTRTTVYQRYQCQDCGAWSRGEKIDVEKVILR